MGWRSHNEVGADHTAHVWPEDDDAHATDSGDPPCWCKPEVYELIGGNVLVVHRDALDRSGLRRPA